MTIRVNDINVHGYWEFDEIRIADNGEELIGVSIDHNRERNEYYIPIKDILSITVSA